MIHKLVLLVAAMAISSAIAAAAPVRMQLKHTDAGRGLTPRELLHRMAQRSKARAERLLSEGASVPVTPGQLDAEYLAHFAIGTPPQPVELTLDTGSDLTWTQCGSCPSCYDQALPYFEPSFSSTSAKLPCGSPACQDLPLSSCGTHKSLWGNQTCVYTYLYEDNSFTTGVLEVETFTFAGAAAVPGVAFGCGLFNNGLFMFNATGTGIAGFGRGPLSLPSQLKVDNFSYCFTAMTASTPSSVLLGLPANLYSSARAAVQTTPLIRDPGNPTFYYLSLKGITVGSTMLPIPESTFELTNGTGGAIIDSGTGMTVFPPDVYNLVHDEFIAQVSLPVLDSTATPLCFTSPPGTKPDVPKLILHFDGATLDLPRENYIFDGLEEAGVSVTCLVVNPGGAMTIIGNYQQQNMHVLYDLANNMLSFVPAHCDEV